MAAPSPPKGKGSPKAQGLTKPKNDFRFAPKPVTDDMLKQTYFNSRHSIILSPIEEQLSRADVTQNKGSHSPQ
jgi:hypothetical protein